MIGFALFTASISWIMSTYPALFRQRHLARDITLLQRSQQQSGTALIGLSSDGSSAVLRDFASPFIGARNDYVQFPFIYYFRTSDPRSSLSLALPPLVSLARTAAGHPEAAMRLNGTMLLEALQDLAEHLAETWLECEPDDGIDVILAAYASDHLHDVQGEEA